MNFSWLERLLEERHRAIKILKKGKPNIFSESITQYIKMTRRSVEMETSKAKNNIMTSSETKEMLVSQQWYQNYAKIKGMNTKDDDNCKDGTMLSKRFLNGKSKH